MRLNRQVPKNPSCRVHAIHKRNHTALKTELFYSWILAYAWVSGWKQEHSLRIFLQAQGNMDEYHWGSSWLFWQKDQMLYKVPWDIFEGEIRSLWDDLLFSAPEHWKQPVSYGRQVTGENSILLLKSSIWFKPTICIKPGKQDIALVALLRIEPLFPFGASDRYFFNLCI